MTDDLGPRQRAAETKRKRTRAALLDAAALVFSEQGWQARMEDVAQRAGVGAATAYNHFPSKVDLMMHTFGRVMEPYAEKASHDIANQVDPIFAITRYITDLCHDLKRSHRNLVAAYLSAAAEVTTLSVGPLIIDAQNLTMTSSALPEIPLANLIGYGQEAGAFRSDEMAWTVGFYHTYAMLWMIVGSVPTSIKKGGSSVADFVLHQLLSSLRLE